MQTPEDLSPEEQREIDNKISAALFDAEMNAHSYVAPNANPAVIDSFFDDIRAIEAAADAPARSVGSLIALEDLPDPDQLVDEADASAAVKELLRRLSDACILLDDRPYHLSAKGFYRWLRLYLYSPRSGMLRAGNGWYSQFNYAGLEPRSPQNMATALDVFFQSLFDLRREMDCWMLAGATYEGMESVPPPQQSRYLRNWRASFRSLEWLSFTPLLPSKWREMRATLPFEISYRGRTEDRHPVDYSGGGRALLAYEDPYWNIVAISFPGFELVEEEG